jgi:hypothetical protein
MPLRKDSMTKTELIAETLFINKIHCMYYQEVVPDNGMVLERARCTLPEIFITAHCLGDINRCEREDIKNGKN